MMVKYIKGCPDRSSSGLEMLDISQCVEIGVAVKQQYQ